MKPDWILTDLESIVPLAARGRVSRIDAWQIMDYETETFSGTLVMASPNGRPPPLRIPLPLTGRYDLLIGMHVDMCDRLRLKLEADRSYDRLAYDIPASAGHPGFQEVYWRTVDLDGQETLTLAKDPEYRISVGYIAARKSAAPPPAHPRRYLLHVTDDGFPANWGMPDDVEDATWMVDRLARRGVDIVSRGIDICGMANYTTGLDAHRIPAAECLGDQFCRPIEETNFQILDRFEHEGVCVPRRYFAVARDLGIQPLGYHRMAHIRAPFPFHCYGSRFYDEHPEWRCVDIDGRPVNRLSYAFPGVRQAFYDLLTEVVQLGAAGINNVYVRGLPAVLYEDPVRRRFQEKHGQDPAKLPENHPEAQAVRADFVTEYMRGQRAALTEAAAGQPVTIMATVPADRETCAFYGLDLHAWAREGLIDILCPYAFGLDAGATPVDLDYHCDAVRDTPVKCLPFANTWRDHDAVQFLERALEWTKWPIDGFSFWDGVLRSVGFDRAMTALYSPEAMRERIAELQQSTTVHHELVMLQGVHHRRYNFGWNF
ncbi:hypothetical protein HQ590_16700 [bacterium]|nr:hypothetical protein [bacterium]